MKRTIRYRPLMAAALAGVMALSAEPALAQHRDRGWHDGHDRGHHGRYDRGYRHGGRDNTGAIIGGALLGLGVLGGAFALQQSMVAPPPAYYVPPPGYAPPAYAPPPGYYGY